MIANSPFPMYQARLTQFYDRDTSYPFTFLEVNGPSGWGSLCYNDTLNSVSFSDVVCREASSMFSYSVMRGVVSPPYRGPLYSGSMACNGTEWSVSKCSQDLSLVSEASCPNGQTVVQCTPGECCVGCKMQCLCVHVGGIHACERVQVCVCWVCVCVR